MLGGKDVEDECEAFVMSGYKPLPGQAFVTKPGKLDTCSHVIHAVVSLWEGGHQKEADFLFTAVENSLNIAASKKLSTVAIAGVDWGFLASVACQAILDAVVEFQSNQHHFTEVILIDNRDQVVNHFHENLAKHFGKQQVKIVSGQPAEMPLQNINTTSACMIPFHLFVKLLSYVYWLYTLPQTTEPSLLSAKTIDFTAILCDIVAYGSSKLARLGRTW